MAVDKMNIQVFVLLVGIIGLATAQNFTVNVVRKTTMIGPALPAQYTAFDDTNNLLLHGQLSQVALALPTSGSNIGLSSWYGTWRVNHGTAADAKLAYVLSASDPIVKVRGAFRDASPTQAAGFTTLAFITKSGKSTQFGLSYASGVHTFEYSAPAGSYLVGFAGAATSTTLLQLQLLWGKPVVQVSPYYIGASSPIAVGFYTQQTGVSKFSDSANALKQGRITRIAMLRGSEGITNKNTTSWGPSGVLVTYGQYVTRHASRSWTVNSTNSVTINAKIGKVEGSYFQGTPGFWGHLSFYAYDGRVWTLGTPYTGAGAKTFSATPPQSAGYLGAFAGYESGSDLRAIQLIWYKDFV